ncbi:MAG TPA: chemotaxis protein CheB [Rhodospirillaceae bacterium]|nr:chemotaxis protein CheB [Rhodospirillaceae bacterium]
MSADAAGYRAAVIGCSAGGLEALRRLLRPLPEDMALALVVVSHMAADSNGLLPELLARTCRLPVVEAEEKTPALAGRVHVGPAGYHLLVEADGTFSLSLDDKVNNVRPAIDVLFDSAADTWRAGLVGILLTGANSDGTAGLGRIRRRGGLCLVQDPDTAFADTMPRSAVNAGFADHVLELDRMADFLCTLPGARRSGQ